MPITTDFNTFANSYHKNTGNKYRPTLPNILIMDIIKMATEQKRLDDARKHYQNKLLPEFMNVELITRSEEPFIDIDEQLSNYLCSEEFAVDNTEHSNSSVFGRVFYS